MRQPGTKGAVAALAIVCSGCISWHESREVVRQDPGAADVQVREIDRHDVLQARLDGAVLVADLQRVGQCAEVTRTPVTTATAVRYERDVGGSVVTGLVGVGLTALGIGLISEAPAGSCNQNGGCRIGGLTMAAGALTLLALASGGPGRGKRDHLESTTTFREAFGPAFACHDGAEVDALVTAQLPDGEVLQALTDGNGVARLPLPSAVLTGEGSALVAAHVRPAVAVRVAL